MLFLGIERKLYVADALQGRLLAARRTIEFARSRDRLVITLLPLTFLEQTQSGREHTLVLGIFL